MRRRGTRDCPPAPDLRVLLACARLDTDEAALRSALGHVKDWDALRLAAAEHAMLPLLYRRITELCPDAVPAPFLARLGGLYRDNSRRNLMMSAGLLRILGGLETSGVRAVAFKGPVLAQLAYGDAGMRVYGDLDLFVAEADVEQACGLLNDQGFEQLGDPRLSEYLGRHSYHLRLEHRRSGLLVEVHWRTGPAYVEAAFSADELLQRARVATVLGRRVLGLHPQDLFLMLCVHGAAHMWRWLELVATLGAVVRVGGLGDVGLMLKEAQARGCLRRCLIAGVLARDVAGAVLPEPLEAAISRDEVAVRLARSLQWGLGRNEPESGINGTLRYVRWVARSLDTPWAAARFVMLFATAPREADLGRGRLPHGLRGLYYIVRPARFAISSLKDATSRFGTEPTDRRLT